MAWSRRSLTRFAVCAAFALALLGCQTTVPQRRNIGELVEEALLHDAQNAAPEMAPMANDHSAISFVSHQEPLEGAEPTGEHAEDHTPPQLDDAESPRMAAASHPANDKTPAAKGPRVSESFLESDIREALQVLANQAKVSLIIDEQISGLTSAQIENEPFEAALQKLLLPLGYTYRWHQGQYLIGVSDPESSLFPLIAVRREYRPMHLSAQELLSMLSPRDHKYLWVVEKRNRIIIEAPDALAEKILLDLQAADEPVPQVVLEARVCVFSPEARKKIGLDFQHGVAPGATLGHGINLQNLAFSGAVNMNNLGAMFSNFNYTSYFLQLLAQEGYVKIRAAPRVMAKDGEKAEISIARETFFSIQPNNANLLFQQQIQKVEAGITLNIVPVIRGDNVTVTIERAEVSENVRGLGTGTELASQYPVINRRRVSTTVHVKDGQTIVIGGLVQKQIVDTHAKVAFFGDIPLVGKLFRRIDKVEQETEVVIFLAPRIVHAPPAAYPPSYPPQGEGALGPPPIAPIPLDQEIEEVIPIKEAS